MNIHWTLIYITFLVPVSCVTSISSIHMPNDISCEKFHKRCYEPQLWMLLYSHWEHIPLMFLAINTLRLRQNGLPFADYIFKCIFLNENVWILIRISLKFVPKCLINNIPALVQIMAWHGLFANAYVCDSASMSWQSLMVLPCIIEHVILHDCKMGRNLLEIQG